MLTVETEPVSLIRPLVGLAQKQHFRRGKDTKVSYYYKYVSICWWSLQKVFGGAGYANKHLRNYSAATAANFQLATLAT